MKIYDVLYGRDTINFYLKRAITRSCVAECNSPKYKARVSLHLYLLTSHKLQLLCIQAIGRNHNALVIHFFGTQSKCCTVRVGIPCENSSITAIIKLMSDLFSSFSKMLHDGPLRHILGELTNTVYEEPTIDDFGEHGQLLSKGDGEICPYTLFLGIFVSLLPKVWR